MANSAFWQDIAKQFRALPKESVMLRADRVSAVGNLVVGEWTLVGTTSHSVQFETLARRAASEIPNPASSDLLTAWLEALITRSGARFNSEMTSTHKDQAGATSAHEIGSLYRLPELSADYCKMLESAALQTEFEEKQRNDPRNWSGLRQEFEAVRQLRELIAGPHETITEQFVREAIARHSGTKPEDVTAMQIRSEVAGLIREYPITYIPTASASESTGEVSIKSEPMLHLFVYNLHIAAKAQVVALRCNVGLRHAETLGAPWLLAFAAFPLLPAGEDLEQVVLGLLVGGKCSPWHCA